MSERRPAAILGHVPPPPLWRRPIRATLAALHSLGFRLWQWAGRRMDDDQPRRIAPQVEMANEEVEFWTEQTQRAKREANELSQHVAELDEKWRHTWNRLREYEDASGEAV